MWRRATIADAAVLSDTEVWEYNVPTLGVLNGIFLQLRATNGATSNLANALEQCIASVQLRDGGRCLMDVTGPQLQFLSLLNSGQAPRSVISEGPDDVQTYQGLALFGRHLYDDEVGLDLSRLQNPKVRVDFDLTAVRAAGATGFVTGTGRISSILVVNDGSDVPSPTGYVKSAEIKRWTTAASGEETVQGPMDGPWMRAIVRAHVANNNPDDVLTNIKVSMDSGKFVPVDELTRWSADGLGQFLGFVPKMAYTCFKADTETYDTRSGGFESMNSQALIDTNVACVQGFEAGRPTINLNVLGAGTTQATEDDIYLNGISHAPYMCMGWDFVREGLLDVSPYSRGDIVLTQGVGSAAASVVLQQLMAQEAG